MITLLDQPWIQHVGWTLIQFLWQGTLLSILFAIVRALFSRWMTAHARYILACWTLGVMVVSPVATFFAKPTSPPLASWPLPSVDSWQPILPWLVLTWLSGVIVFSVKLIGGWRVTARMRSAGVRPAPPEWQETLEQLIHTIGVSRPVRLLISSMVEVPTVIGWLRPVILVPMGALTGLPAEHIQALLAHELAHIRRVDYLVNILQSIAEAVLFYHPAVWWVSDQIRAERELCCDDLAVAASGDVLTYARALAEMESCRPARSKVALAANGGSLLNRIRRLIGQSQPVSHTLPGPGAAGAMSLLWLIGIGAVAAHGAPVTPPARTIAMQRFTRQIVIQPGIAQKRPILSTFLFSPYGPAPEPQAPPAQNPSTSTQQNTGRIEGMVVSTTGSPIPRATVQLLGLGVVAKVTDDNGKFVFEDVPTSRYRLQAMKTGFITGAYGAPAPGTQAPQFTIESGTNFKDAVIKLIPHGVVSGQVTNQDRDPVERAAVTVYRSTYVRGRKQLARAGGATTDDEGNFRIAGLAPGRYYLGVQPAGGSAPGEFIRVQGGVTSIASLTLDEAFAAGLAAGAAAGGATARTENGLMDVATFFPNALNAANAAPLEISAGSHMERIDVRLRREGVHSIKGKVTLNGAAAPNPMTLQVTRSDGGVTIQSASTQVRQGEFTVDNLPAGTYVLQSTFSTSSPVAAFSAFTSAPVGRGGNGLLASGTSLTGRIEVAVGNSNVNGIVLNLEPGVSVTGSFKSDEGDFQTLLNAVPPTGPQGRVPRPGVALVREDGTGGTGQATNSDDGTFVLAQQAAPGKYLVQVARLADNFYVKSIRFAGQDITKAPLELGAGGGNLEIVLSAKAASISGVLRNEKGEPQSGVTVVIWPKILDMGNQTLGVKSVTTDQSGNFKAPGLAPGDYSVAGWEGEGSNSSLLQIPDLLAHLANEATAVKLAESSQVSVDAKMISAAKIAAEVAKLP